MPFCPKCKAEYQEGFTVCSDCKVDLVEDLKTAEELIPFFQAEDKKIAEKLVKFFNYSDVNSSIAFDEENEVYVVLISPKKQMEAKKLYQAFYFVERERLLNGESDLVPEVDESNLMDVADTSDDVELPGSSSSADSSKEDAVDADDNIYGYAPESEDSSEEEYAGETPSDEVSAFDDDDADDAAPYIMKADQYKDLNGTVWIFLFFGVAGLIVVLLNVIGVLSLFNGWIPNAVMAALFLFFIYVAITTNQKAKRIQAEIAEENALTERINEWLKANITEAFVTSLYSESISEELNYLKVIDTIKEMLIKEFGSQNLSYLDRIIEEYYNSNIENS